MSEKTKAVIELDDKTKVAIVVDQRDLDSLIHGLQCGLGYYKRGCDDAKRVEEFTEELQEVMRVAFGRGKQNV